MRLGGNQPVEFSHQSDRHWQSEINIREDSNYEIGLKSGDAAAPLPSIFTIQAIKDQPPEAHIVEPKNDLLFNESNRPKVVVVKYSLNDDFGVGQADLKYIKSTGEGDSAKFESGSIPLKANGGRSINAEVFLNLDQLKLGPGDSLVYHIEARDRNNITGPGIGFSENLVIAVASPEKEKIALDDLRPDELGKMLISERMIIIHTERLNAQRSKLSKQEFIDKSNTIAAEQRTLKQSFTSIVEVEGGEQEEAAEATSGSKDSVASAIASAEEKVNDRLKVHDHGIVEAPEGGHETVKNLVLAVRAMWDAEGSLNQGETDKALPPENLALKHLKLAQGGLRYFSQAKVSIKPIDLKRRYAGELKDIKIRLEKLSTQKPTEDQKASQAILSDVYFLLKQLTDEARDKPATNNKELNQLVDKVDSDSDKLLGIHLQFQSVAAESAAKMKLATVAIRNNIASDHPTDSSLDNARSLLSQAATALISALDSDQAKGLISNDNNISSTERDLQARYLQKLRR